MEVIAIMEEVMGIYNGRFGQVLPAMQYGTLLGRGTAFLVSKYKMNGISIKVNLFTSQKQLL